jgi:demethylmenaquinone methyltransferase/2-methoxy-6-polyprenyl-1,4-benzoquinol methylase
MVDYNYGLIMSISYSLISKFYGLLDIIYFRKKCNNPRYILLDKIMNNDSKILEIVIGTAENSILLAKHKSKINIIGIDLSEDMLEIAKNKTKKENIVNIDLIKMDAMNMKFDNETFDFIIISLLLHEIPENIANKILNECIRILKSDGKIYVLEWEEPNKIIKKIIFSIIKVFEPKWYKQFMKKDLSIYFMENNLKINSIEYGDYSKVIELIKSATIA